MNRRNIATFLSMLVCLLGSQNISLQSWVPWVFKETKAASKIRRFVRWLENNAIVIHTWHQAILLYALRGWSTRPIYLALDTSMLFDRFCCIRVSMIYLQRAIPVSWKVLEHKSSSVKFIQYRSVLDQAYEILSAKGVQIIFLADRGFVSKELMCYLSSQARPWRIRIKANQKLKCNGRSFTAGQVALFPGKAVVFPNGVYFGKGLEGLSFSAGWAKGASEPWYVLSDSGSGKEIFDDYAHRFDIEEGFRDEKGGGFDLESSRIREAKKLERLILILATAEIFAVGEGVFVISSGRRELVDSHWNQGLSFFQIGLRWIKEQLLRGLIGIYFELKPINNPLPIAPTRKESQRRRRRKDPAYLFSHILHFNALDW